MERKRKLLGFGLVVSILLNIFLVAVIICSNFDNGDTGNNVTSARRLQMAEKFVRKAVCDNLFYPESYDPVTTTVDSVFYSIMTDGEVLQAVEELIDLKSEYATAESQFNEAVDMIKFHGMTDLGTMHWGKDRDTAKTKMQELEEKINNCRSSIINRNSSRDGDFVGWQVYHRYRAANQAGTVSFGEVIYLMSPNMKTCYGAMTPDHIKKLQKAIEEEMGRNSAV